MYLGTLGNIILACATNFYCTIFIPTLPYLGCFRGHDRIFIVTCTFYSLVLPILYFGGYLHFRAIVNGIEKNAMLVCGIASCLSLT